MLFLNHCEHIIILWALTKETMLIRKVQTVTYSILAYDYSMYATPSMHCQSGETKIILRAVFGPSIHPDCLPLQSIDYYLYNVDVIILKGRIFVF